jgi:hypothetical protein
MNKTISSRKIGLAKVYVSGGCKKNLGQWEAKQPYPMVDSQINKVPVYAGAGLPSQCAQSSRGYYQLTVSLYSAFAK